MLWECTWILMVHNGLAKIMFMRKANKLNLGVVVARFLSWYKTDNSGVMPTPSNAQWFWMGIIAITAVTIKILQELNLIGVWVIS